jgi:lysozyme
MKTSPAGLALIESSEGFRPLPYKDVAGILTVGYGHKIKPGEDFSAGLTEAQAQALLQSDLVPVENALAELVPESCTQNQYDALADFGLNLGIGALETMLAHGWAAVPSQMPRWAFARVNGVETLVPGLVARRAAELRMFMGDAPS